MEDFALLEDALDDPASSASSSALSSPGEKPQPSSPASSGSEEGRCEGEAEDDREEMDEETLEKFNRYIEKARELKSLAFFERSLKHFAKALDLSPRDRQLKDKIEKMKVIVEEVKNGDGYYRNKKTKQCELPGGFMLPVDVYDKMYPHQKEGVKWLWERHQDEVPGGILGDDMGLGKTIQIVTFLRGLFNSGEIRHVLIVMPLALLENWSREFSRWYPDIRVKIAHGQGTKKFKDLEVVQMKGGICLTTYGFIRTNEDKLTLKGEHTWSYIILDEGHLIKNASCQISKTIRDLPAEHRLILTGTPVQNTLKELWTLFDFITQGQLFGTSREFKLQFENDIVKATDKKATFEEKVLGEARGEELRNLIKPFLLRREKKTIFGVENAPGDSSANSHSKDFAEGELDEEEGGDLPPGAQVRVTKASTEAQKLPGLKNKKELVIWTYLTDRQIEIYKAFLTTNEVSFVLNKSESPLAALQVLKKICDHPDLLTKSLQGCESLPLEELKVIQTEEEQVQAMIDRAGKMKFLVQLLLHLKAEGRRVLVFSRSKVILTMIQRVLKHHGLKYCRIDGEISDRVERQKYIDTFNSDLSYFCFLLTTEVGGVGLNLTGADRVVLYDPSWNPAKDAQAVDRAYRVGQKNDVVVYRLNTCGTIEEKIYRKQVFKTSLSKTVVKNGNNMRYFTKQDLSELFTLGDPKVAETQVLLEYMHKMKTNQDSGDFAKYLGFASKTDVFGVSDHDMLYSVDDQEITPELAKAIMKANQTAQTQAEEKLKEVPNTPKRPPLPPEKTPRTTRKPQPQDEDDPVVSKANAALMKELLEQFKPPVKPCDKCHSHSLQYLTAVSALYDATAQGRLLLGLNHCLNMVELCPHQKPVHFLAVEMGRELQMTMGFR